MSRFVLAAIAAIAITVLSTDSASAQGQRVYTWHVPGQGNIHTVGPYGSPGFGFGGPAFVQPGFGFGAPVYVRPVNPGVSYGYGFGYGGYNPGVVYGLNTGFGYGSGFGFSYGSGFGGSGFGINVARPGFGFSYQQFNRGGYRR